MIGFFEYQYLRFKKNHLRNLIALAKADGHFHEDEVKFLYKVGEKYGLKDWQIEKLIDSDEPFEVEIPDAFNQRVGLIYDLVGMMLADGVIEQDEVDFIRNMCDQMGFDNNLIDDMIEFHDQDFKDLDAWELFLKDAQKHAIKK